MSQSTWKTWLSGATCVAMLVGAWVCLGRSLPGPGDRSDPPAAVPLRLAAVTLIVGAHAVLAMSVLPAMSRRRAVYTLIARSLGVLAVVGGVATTAAWIASVQQ